MLENVREFGECEYSNEVDDVLECTVEIVLLRSCVSDWLILSVGLSDALVTVCNKVIV